jgi:hypothetical protein
MCQAKNAIITYFGDCSVFFINKGGLENGV